MNMIYREADPPGFAKPQVPAIRKSPGDEDGDDGDPHDSPEVGMAQATEFNDEKR
jgi:hypothetical protein